MSERKLLMAKAGLSNAEALLRSGALYDHAFALCGLHDSVELVVYATLEKIGAKISANQSLLQAWEAVSLWANGDAQKELPMQIEIGRLNKSRVSFKHHAIEPTSDDVREHFANGRQFIATTTRRFFALDFDSLSEVSLVPQPEIKELLESAEKLLEANDRKAALVECARARDKIHEVFSFFFRHPIHVSLGVGLPEVEKLVRAEVVALQSQIKELRQITLANAMGMNFVDYKILYALLPTVEGGGGAGEVSFSIDPTTVHPVQVRNCILKLARFALQAHKERSAAKAPGWNAPPA